jgi:uncharacterized protein (DUF4415 family)
MKRRRTRSVQKARATRTRVEPPVDTSDIPALDDEFFRRAARNPLYKPIKRSTTIRIDADVLAWLRSQGGGYQTRINAILRRAMLDEASAR